MKKGIHPETYRVVVFKDMTNGDSFLSKSTSNTKETIQWEDGNEYPLVKLDISNTSHPFYTGKNMLVDTAGRIDKFKNVTQRKLSFLSIILHPTSCRSGIFLVNFEQ
jgi:large subunit ribosomal protein L31